jgi:hypothetical protein
LNATIFGRRKGTSLECSELGEGTIYFGWMVVRRPEDMFDRGATEFTPLQLIGKVPDKI